MAADPITKSTMDDLFAGSLSDSDDPFADSRPNPRSTRDDKAALSPRKRKAGDDDKENAFADLGLNEEVKIKKARIPNPKLDETLLLSAKGIPKLRAVARQGVSKKLRLKGKGHEFTDVSRLLNYYQLWLDDLFPRARFSDGLKMIEKVGHSKRMAVMRKEWIDEGKPGYKSRETIEKEWEERRKEIEQEELQKKAQQKEQDANNGNMFFASPSKGQKPAQHDEAGEPGDDELDALMAEQEGRSAEVVEEHTINNEEDDLDGLLAEQEARQESAPSLMRASRNEKDDEDDLDALLAEHEAQNPDSSTKAPNKSRQTVFEDESEDEDALNVLLSEQATRQNAALPSEPTQVTDSTPAEITSEEPTYSSSPLPNNPEEEDIDALFASQEAREQAAKEQDQTKEESQDQIPEDWLSSPIPNEE